MTELNWHHRWKLWFSEEKQNFYPSLRKNMEKNNHYFKNSLDNPWPWKAVRLAASFEPWRGPPSGWQRRGMGGEGWSRWRCWRCWSKSNTSILHRFFHDGFKSIFLWTHLIWQTLWLALEQLDFFRRLMSSQSTAWTFTEVHQHGLCRPPAAGLGSAAETWALCSQPSVSWRGFADWNSWRNRM